MKVYINGTWYDPANDLIVVRLNEHDKTNIANMLEHCDLYACYNPENNTPEDVEELLTELKTNT